MHDAGSVGTEFQLAGLELGDGRGEVIGDRACLGVGHQTAGTEHPTQLCHLGHHVWGGDQQVEIHLTGSDFIHEIVIAGLIGTGGLSRSYFFAAGDHSAANRLAGAVGQGHRGAQLLIGVLGIDA